MTTILQEAFHDVLAATRRAEAIPEAQDVYGWLIGSWELEVLHYWGADVSPRGLKGEVHFGWVLEGLAVQDVWIMPRRSDRSGPLDKKLNMYGTTLRVWNATIDAWRITWRNPAGDHHEDQIGRRSGKDIVQVGTRPDGTPTLDVHRDYPGLVSLNRGIAPSGRPHLGAGGGVQSPPDGQVTPVSDPGWQVPAPLIHSAP